ncbi:MAG: PEP-CTERM sorting domain-containing protein [Gammaproteobacteria bacterium]|nr:PEP-CTERM sorting domain-containing protein [Gammaproteobacteria bacterium]
MKRWTLLIVLGLAGAAAQAVPVPLAPLLPSSTPTTSGAAALFIQIANDWTGSTVLWNEAAGRYGDGDPIGATYGGTWGTGLWGRADFDAVLAGGVAPIETWSGVVAEINFGDDCYNSAWSATWGAAVQAPLFAGAVPCALGDGEANAQDNWISSFSGYIRVYEAGLYNFSVLYDDGFFFNLYGAGHESHSISMDFLNPRDRLGFGNDFWLSPGLYGFELGAWERLQAGVVDLRWRRGEGTDWTLVPTESVSIPEPSTLVLLLAGLAVGWSSRAGREARRRLTPCGA